MSKFRILTLDGGGIRGIVTTVLLQRLSADKSLGGWLDSVDLIAGTSTGGLLALGLAHGVDLQTLRELYETKGAQIFDDSWLDNLVDLGQVAGAQYDNKNLERELKRVLGPTTTLSQLTKKVLITSFDLDNESPDPKRRTWKPKVFHNFPGADSDGAELAYKVGLYTSAAPTYFPSVDGYVDGGVFANNPSMCALTQTQDARIRNRPAISEVALLSLGTGTSLVYIPGKRLDWGFAQWVKPLISLMLDGVSGIADYQCQKILGEQYHRLAPVFPPGVSLPLDAVKRVPDMIQFAEGADLTATTKWLRKYWLAK
ncbi:MAG TPA: patatin-like phospholipase family protein [Anaerolineales bacterium]|nr:patatin-like phospholipase family protein [Anaerolineales bacterium]